MVLQVTSKAKVDGRATGAKVSNTRTPAQEVCRAEQALDALMKRVERGEDLLREVLQAHHRLDSWNDTARVEEVLSVKRQASKKYGVHCSVKENREEGNCLLHAVIDALGHKHIPLCFLEDFAKFRAAIVSALRANATLLIPLEGAYLTLREWVESFQRLDGSKELEKWEDWLLRMAIPGEYLEGPVLCILPYILKGRGVLIRMFDEDGYVDFHPPGNAPYERIADIGHYRRRGQHHPEHFVAIKKMVQVLLIFVDS